MKKNILLIASCITLLSIPAHAQFSGSDANRSALGVSNKEADKKIKQNKEVNKNGKPDCLTTTCKPNGSGSGIKPPPEAGVKDE